MQKRASVALNLVKLRLSKAQSDSRLLTAILSRYLLFFITVNK